MQLDSPVARRLASVKNVVIVLAGKGGVGKSSVSTQLALSLYAHDPSARVGILDIDLTGPSIPRMLGVDGHSVRQSTDGWVPVYADGPERRLACMSVGFLLKGKGDSVVWRGPKKNAMIRQFLSDVKWGDLDYLVVDTPPGTSDEHLSLMEHLAPLHPHLSSIIVTTPQAVALADALKCLSFTRNVNLPVLGLIENMSGYVCPCCGKVSNVFSTGGGEAMARRGSLNFLGALPIDTNLVSLLDHEEADSSSTEEREINANAEPVAFPLLERYKETDTFPLFQTMLERTLLRLTSASTDQNPPP
ncbi:MRP-like protein [Cantharellus anzutake]|uniref:MRP-like protein n=1 Tax=Cantharellus anzutake TaxID=1750568 RepID=UPI0019078ABC|nr:MRP-like protein [Cantharellus anzutake]KAF8336970.1 MRP-like protein [Cantharellus anzutake]